MEFGFDTLPAAIGCAAPGSSWLWRALSRFRIGRHRLAVMGLLTVLVVAPGLAVWAAFATFLTGSQLQDAMEVSRVAERARYAIGAEQSLQRLYRLAPAPEVRAAHENAGATLIEALERVRAVGEPEDAPLIDTILARHEAYYGATDHMFAAMDRSDQEAAASIDAFEVDPAFAPLNDEVLAIASRYRRLAQKDLGALTFAQHAVLIGTPVVLGIGAALVLSFCRVLRDTQAQARNGLLREAENARASERRFRGLIQNASDTILICAADRSITYQSPAAESSWGHASAGLIGQIALDLVHPEDRADMAARWAELLLLSEEAGARTAQLRLRDGAGAWRQAEFVANNLLHDPAIAGVVVTIRDVTERKAFEQQLTQQAFYDALTALPNRVLFRDRLEQALVRAARRQDRVGLLFLDLDNFKLVNDSLGHHVGDALLVEAAERLRSAVRAQDTVARISGDEFVVVLEWLGGEPDALPVARAVAEQFSRPFLLSGRNLTVTASIGIAVSGDGSDAESLIRDADVAMYRAKSEGRGRFVLFEPTMHEDALTRLELENDLRRAIDGRQLRVFYQPIVELGSGGMREMEALVRWQHPSRGLVSPGEFIPVAEETGLIIPLGHWVLEEACRQVAAWQVQHPHHPPIVLSVNLSPRQFGHAGLVADVAAALADAGLPASSLKLEITEGVIMQDAETSIRTLLQLKALGVQLAIDDFGTGYSSLSYLQRLPVDVLKIDRSFIKGIGDSAEDAAIVHAIMALAKSLRLKVTGEGVETREQAALLEAWGCDWGQGYLFGRPADAAATGTLLRAAAEAQHVDCALAS